MLARRFSGVVALVGLVACGTEVVDGTPGSSGGSSSGDDGTGGDGTSSSGCK